MRTPKSFKEVLKNIASELKRNEKNMKGAEIRIEADDEMIREMDNANIKKTRYWLDIKIKNEF